MVLALAALLAVSSIPATADRGPPAWPSPAVSFWYDATNASTAYSPRDGAAMLAKVAAHKELITSVILL